jgi:glutathione synthase/RimK-type ligase-like ATP-grasp enzyme
MAAQIKTLGIMAICHGSIFMEKAYYRKLTLIGRRLGIRVFVFSPRKVDFQRRMVDGYTYQRGVWTKGTFPLPHVIYDRVFIGPSYRQYKPFIDKLQNDPEIIFMGRGLTGKWQVHQILSKSTELAKWLPETNLYTFSTLLSVLERDGAAVIKPIAGTHGAGVVRIVHADGNYAVTGRNQQNKPFQRVYRSTAELHRFTNNFIAGRKFLVQTYLSLQTPDGTPYDVRVLVQKNSCGEWETTGKAVRMGDKNSITSNLHGGGKAMPLSSFLARYFPEEKQTEIEQEMDQLIELLPPFLEQYHGRLVELGVDVGIDADGNVWIIEVNSKPGRTVFRYIDDREARIRSITQPVSYAHYLMKERVGGY